MRISDWSSDVCSSDLIAKQVNGDREADECEHERMVWMTGKIIGHSGSPWLVAGNRSVPSPRSKTRTLSPRSLPSHRGEQGPMGRAGGPADSLPKQPFRPSPRSGGWPVLLATGEKLVTNTTTAARSARRHHPYRGKSRST